MYVDSYIELFTTMFGWNFYNVVWDTLADTGIDPLRQPVAQHHSPSERRS